VKPDALTRALSFISIYQAYNKYRLLCDGRNQSMVSHFILPYLSTIVGSNYMMKAIMQHTVEKMEFVKG
jgi:hypothetical protein